MDRQTVAIEVKKALNETVLLSDGRRGFVITELQDGKQDKWKCNVCVRVLANERAMLMHLSHPLHMSKMRASVHPAENFPKRQIKEEHSKDKEVSSSKKDEKPWATDSVRPGEPVPPGMEDVVKKICKIQESLDKHPGPIIGIEYIVELVSAEEETEPKYICLLCEKKGDPRSVMVHLASATHALKYISCFFRTAGNAINMIPKSRENRKGISIAVIKIAEAIEKKFGRLKPTIALTEKFAGEKYEILRAIDEREHFRETSSTTFLEFCSIEKIREYAKQAEDEINSMKNKTFDENDLKAANERSDDRNQSGKDSNSSNKTSDPPTKLSFSIGKPERSLGRNAMDNSSQPKELSDDDEVIFVGSSKDPVEVQSMSPISSISDNELKPLRSKNRSRSRSQERRRREVLRRRLSPRRRSPYRDSFRHRSRSRSRSRGRYYRERDRSRRSSRELDRIYGRDRRSPERTRYDSRSTSDHDRRRRSISLERERRRSPRPVKRERLNSPSGSSKDYSAPEYKKKSTSQFKVKMDAYRKKLHDLEVEMENKLKYYRSHPEKHPQYSEEWKNFWNRRYKELQQAGKDPTGYDFKPEWIIFWDGKVKELHEQELSEKKEELKSLLPKEEEKEPLSDLQDISPPTPESSKDVTVDDIKNTWKALTGSDIKAPSKPRLPSPDTRPRSPLPKRSPSPWEDRKVQSNRKPINTYTADPPIVHCLRMLSVLEQQLGSLGPKALDLLSKAILMEKIKHNESMLLLEQSDIHIFFETVKEKIRGQLIAGIVARHLVNSCRSLINSIESMLASHPLKPKPLVQPKPTYTPIQPEPVKVAGVGLVNKMAIAQQIAEVLITQGRTDVSQQELEELINAVVGIASTSNANPNQPSASFIAQLNIQQSTASSHINNLLSNIITSAQKIEQPQATPLPVAAVPSLQPNTLTQSLQPNPLTPSLLPETVTPSLLSQAATPSLLSQTATSSLLTQSLTSSSHPAQTVTSSLLTRTQSPSLFSETSSISQSVASSITTSNSVKAFTDAVSATKSIVSEQASSVSSSSIVHPIKELSVEKEVSPSKKLSDDELKDRLMKFKSLSRDDQQSLIVLLKELESAEPDRVEKLRKYVTAGLAQDTNPPKNSVEPDSGIGRLSPFSTRTGGVNPAPDDKKRSLSLMNSGNEDDDDDDDDYSVEDVYKSVSEKLKNNQTNRKTDFMIDPDELLSDSEASLQNKNKGKSRSPSPYPSAKSMKSDQQANRAPERSNYSVFPVGESNTLAPISTTYSTPIDKYQLRNIPVTNSYSTPQWPEKSWGDQPRDNQQWSGNKPWSQGNALETYPSNDSTRYSTREGNNFPQSTPQYRPSGPYYGSHPVGQYGSSQPGNYGSNQNTSYGQNQNVTPQFNNYQRPPPGQPYYDNYRQY